MTAIVSADSLHRLVKQGEPRSPVQTERIVSFPAFMKRLRKRESRLLAYMLAVQVMAFS